MLLLPTTQHRLAFNAIFLYVAAYLVTIMLHELGHAGTSWLLNGHPILHNTWVQNTNPTLSEQNRLLIMLAGPVLSLVQGIVLLSYVRLTQCIGTLALFWLYMGAFGLMNFLGYVMIAPLVPSGDTGQIVALLHIPQWAQWTAAAVALFALSRSIRRTGPLFLRQLPTQNQADTGLRAEGMKALLLWPWLIGSLILVVLSLPAPQIAILLNIPMSSMVLRGAYVVALRSPIVSAAISDLLRRQWTPVVAVIVLAGIFRYLSHGVTW